MAELGTFISDPKDYQIHFTHRFSEPAWFFVRPDGVVKYIDVASMPMGAGPAAEAPPPRTVSRRRERQAAGRITTWMLTTTDCCFLPSVSLVCVGGRVHVDDLLAGHNWVLQESKDRPEFEKVVWGSVV